MSLVTAIQRDQRGAAIVEFALALPILIMMIWGIFQVGVAFQASAGMQSALGEGARYATLYPTPTDDEIRTRVNEKVFGTGIGSFSAPVVTSYAGYKEISVSFTMQPNFLFFEAPAVTLNRSRRVYTAT